MAGLTRRHSSGPNYGFMNNNHNNHDLIEAEHTLLWVRNIFFLLNISIKWNFLSLSYNCFRKSNFNEKNIVNSG